MRQERLSRMGKRLLRWREVSERTGLGRSALYEYTARGEFPRKVKVGLRAVAWVGEEVEAWIEARVAEQEQPERSC